MRFGTQPQIVSIKIMAQKTIWLWLALYICECGIIHIYWNYSARIRERKKKKERKKEEKNAILPKLSNYVFNFHTLSMAKIKANDRFAWPIYDVVLTRSNWRFYSWEHLCEYESVCTRACVSLHMFFTKN